MARERDQFCTVTKNVCASGAPFCRTTVTPGGLAGVTSPKPTPYTEIISPGLAGRKETFGIRPTGPTNAPLLNCAIRYCLSPILKLAGASNPGALAAFVPVVETLPPGLVT